MTTIDAVKPWDQPAHAKHNHPGGHDRAQREYGIEAMLRLGSLEYEMPEWALTQLAIMRPDLTVEQLIERVDELIELTCRVREARDLFGMRGYDAAVDEYEMALAALADFPMRAVAS